MWTKTIFEQFLVIWNDYSRFPDSNFNWSLPFPPWIESHHVAEKSMGNTILRHFADGISDKFVALLEEQVLRERAKRVHIRALLVN